MRAPYIGGRGRRLGLVTLAIFAVGGGIAYATVPDSGGVFNACMLKATGTVRMVDPSAPGHSLLSHPCNTTLETSISFNQRGQQGPPGPQGNTGPQGPPGESVHGYRENRGVNGQIQVTGLGQDPNGLPTTGNDPSQTTDIVSIQVPQGVYYLQISVNVLKLTGHSVFSCWVGNKQTDTFTGLTRTALGGEAGTAGWASLSAPGFFNVPAGGETLTLQCSQAGSLSPGPTGEDPLVYQANINALRISGATITNFVTGGVTEIP